MSDIPKAYEPQAVEEKWYQFWLDHQCFAADPARVSAGRPAYSIVIPPPNITGILHLGHVLNNTIQDILARKARMDGKEVLWLPGTDHASISTHSALEKELRSRGLMRHREDLGREKFLEHAWAWKEKYGGIIIRQLKKLGCSCDWSRERFTMDADYSRCVQQVFVALYKKGNIYRGKRMVNWDPAARTALSDEEVEMVETKGHLWYLKYPVLDDAGRPAGDQFVVVATTRPETMLGDEAVAVNPKDERYAKLVGRKVLLPLQNKPLPIITDEFVDPKFGTGCVKVTPAHDPNDYAMATRHHLPLTVVIGPDGKITRAAGADFAGLDRMAARAKVIERLTTQGLVSKVEDYLHHVGHSQRTGVPIEPHLSEQWFLKYPRVAEGTRCVEAGTIRFHPDRWAKTYTHWMTHIQDWCISRQLWWGHRIPVWYNPEGMAKLAKRLPVVDLSGEELRGANLRELRAAAWTFANRNGLLNRTFRNEETGWDILVRPASLEHAFSHRGSANIKAVVALAAIIRTALKVGTLWHVPASKHFKCVHRFVAAARIAGVLYQVKITVKEHVTGQKLYDHQLLNATTPDGVSPMPAAVASGPTRPTSGADVLIRDLFRDVNSDTTYLRCQIEAPGPDWHQDPDVLDTWFSSWLWPFATMGWPHQSPTLKAFYPTTDLVTGPDIIFFWVARMIMAGYEFMGDAPFRNVYFTGIIRDKQGRKMSKSLGNSPDPLALIAKYGADALRFGTMRSAPLGQDVLFDEKDVELGRNFCNKLWNACRFRQMQGGPTESDIDPALLASDDKWVLLRLDQAIREIDTAFAEYRFSEVTQTLYRFFWSEFCDWYLEASKATLSRGAESLRREPVESLNGDTVGSEAGPITQRSKESTTPPSNASTTASRRANVLAVIDFVLSRTLRLFHPFLPFITEELWQAMGYQRDLTTGLGGETIMLAPWPRPLESDFKARHGLGADVERFVSAKYQMVVEGRNLRREASIPSNKAVRFVWRHAEAFPREELAVLRILLNADAIAVVSNYDPPKGTPVVHPPLGGEFYLPLAGLIDIGAERARLTKELAKIDGEIAKVRAKLDNPAFRERVPAAVFDAHQNRLADWQAKQHQVKNALETLG